TEDTGDDLVRAHQPETIPHEDFRNARQQMVVAAAKDAQDPRQQPQRLEVGPDSPDRGPHQRSDENDVAAAFAAGEATKPAELPDRRPVMRQAGDLMRGRPPPNREKHDTAAPPAPPPRRPARPARPPAQAP